MKAQPPGQTSAPALPDMIKISLIITTFNDPFRLENVLSHCVKLKPQPAEILVCDDGSKEETRKLIEGFARTSPTPIIHVYQENHGWDAPGIRNYGAIRATGDYLVMIDGDCVPHPQFLADHLAAAEQGFFVFGERAHVVEEHVAGFSTRMDVVMKYILTRKINKRRAAIRWPWDRAEVFARDSFTAMDPLASIAICCNFAVWRRDLLEINGFDESFRAWWPEDSECAARLLNRGVKLKKFHNRCLVYHLNHGERSRVCHDEFRFSENSLLSGKTRTTNGIAERLARLKLPPLQISP